MSTNVKLTGCFSTQWTKFTGGSDSEYAGEGEEEEEEEEGEEEQGTEEEEE